MSVGTAAARPPTRERPNILWLVSEDNNPFIGAYGDVLAHTPTIDALAQKGVLFRNVYSNAPVCAPTRFTILTGLHAESCAPANHMRAEATLPPDFRTYPELMRAAGYYCTNNAKTDYNCVIDPEKIWDRQGMEAHWRSAPKGQPFMAVFNYETTHESQLFKPTKGRVTGDQVKLPRYLPDTAGIRNDYASYYNLMEKMDTQIGARLAELEADGLYDDTIIFYYSDNGGSLPRSKRYCYDEGHRCAMIVYVPPKWRHLSPAAPGGEIATPVSYVDLAPTVLSLAGASIPAQLHGQPFMGPRAKAQHYAFGMRNRMDERIDFMRTVTDGRWRYIRNYMPHRPWGQHQAFEWLAKGYQGWEAAHLAGALTPVQDRFFRTKPFEELYDLKTDPDEVANRVADPAAAAMLTAMRHALDRHMVAINDNGFLPEAMQGEGYVASRERGRYPLPHLMTLAQAAAQRDPTNIDLFRTSLESSVPVVRYWGAMGLLMLGPSAKAAANLLRNVMSDDPADQVRIVAAEAMTMIDDVDISIDVLASIADAAPQWQVRLQAINALTFVGSAAQSALPTIRRAADSEQEYVRNAGRYLTAKLTGTYRPSSPIFDLERLMRRVREANKQAT